MTSTRPEVERKWLLLTATYLAAAMVMTSCGSSGGTAGPSPTPVAVSTTVSATTAGPLPTLLATTAATTLPTRPIRGGNVTIGIDADLVFGFENGEGVFLSPSLNPLRDGSGGREVARLVVPGAYRLDAATGELTPWLIDEIPTTANGGVEAGADGTVTVTYRIREEALWEDGTPVTGTDLVLTHELITSPPPDFAVDASQREIHDLVEPGSLVADGKTLTLRLTSPDPRYERLFEWVVPAHAVDPATFASAWNEALWLSGGPFRFVSSDPPTDPEREPGVIRLERNPTYWETDPTTGDALPYLDGIDVLAFTPGAFTIGVAKWFENRSVDALLGSLVPSHEQGLLGDPHENGFELAGEWDSLIEVMVIELGDGRFTVNPDSLNEHLDYRQAVLAATDREAVAQASDSRAVGSIVGTAIDALDHGAWSQHDDPSQVGDLLATLGDELARDFATDPPTAVYVSSSGEETIAIGEAVAAGLERAGFVASSDFAGDFFGTQWPDGHVDLYAFRMFAGTGGLGSLAQSMTVFDPSRDDRFTVSWQGVDEAATRYSELMSDASTELDHDRLAALLTEAEEILADTALVYPLVRRQHRFRPYWPERIQGIVPNRYQGWDTWNAAWWWSPTG